MMSELDHISLYLARLIRITSSKSLLIQECISPKDPHWSPKLTSSDAKELDRIEKNYEMRFRERKERLGNVSADVQDLFDSLGRT